MNSKELKLDKLLRSTLGSDNIYFQPPESVKLKFPCIIYNLAKVSPVYADSRAYLQNPKYVIKYVTTEPDDQMRFTLVDVLGVPIINVYCRDGLYYYIYELYY